MHTTPQRAEITLANWRLHPFSTFSFQNVSEFVPVAHISHGVGGGQSVMAPGVLDEMDIIDRDGSLISPAAHAVRSHTDHMVIMRDGKILAEWLAPHADAAKPHLIFSISKSLTGLLAGIAVHDGFLDVEKPVADYVSSMRGSTYETARVRDLLDMTVDVDFDEEYLDDDSAFDRYRRAMLWNPERPDSKQETMESFLSTLGAQGYGHGRRFYYASPNTDLLGLVIERATGTRLHHYMSEKLWKPMGAKDAAYVSMDRVGTARTAGGICITTRDLARIGQLVLDNGQTRDGQQIVPGAWVDDLRKNGNRQAWVDGNFADMFPAGRYRSCWYDVGDERGSFAAVGIHGQWLWADSVNRVVIAKTSSRPAPSDDNETQLEILMLSQIARLF